MRNHKNHRPGLLRAKPAQKSRQRNKMRQAASSEQGKSLSLESLETRMLLSINAPVFNETTSAVAFYGSSLDDFVTVSELSPGVITLDIASGGEVLSRSYDQADLSSVIFFGYEGDDQFTNTTSISSVAYGGIGNDVLSGGSGDDDFRGEAGDDELYGGGAADRLDGGFGNDFISGGTGDDHLLGLGGHDIIRGGDGADLIKGGDGTDQLHGDAGADVILGQAGDDRIFGNSGDDQLLGGDDNDLLFGGTDNDQLYGESGADVLRGEDGDDQLLGGDGNDELDGGNNDDYLRGNAGADWLAGRQGNDILLGDEGNDRLLGMEGNDELYGGDDNDQLYGGAGNDQIFGESGADLLRGEDGDDQLLGGDGNDELDGGNNDDYLRGNAGADWLAGRQGNDLLLGDGGNDKLLGMEGNDELYGGGNDDQLYGGTGNDQLYGESGADVLRGEDGDDQLLGGDGNDELDGGNNDDYLRGNAGADWLAGRQGNDLLLGDGGNDKLLGMEGNDELYGGDDNDQLFGGTGNDQLYGESGADVLRGEDGDDQLLGGDGNDELDGGNNDDYLRGDIGNDRLDGRQGNDLLLGDEGNDKLLGMEGNDELYGGDDNDQLFGGTGNDKLYGESGADVLRGEDGDDQLLGGAGNDDLDGGSNDDYLRGDDGDDRLAGQLGNDKLLGDAGRDILFGGAGDDELHGYEGADALVGGAGDDELNGGIGDDVLIGGSGVDALNGQGNDDLLLGGRSVYDLEVAAIDTLLEAWSNGSSYESRVQSIEHHSFAAYIKSMDTALDDLVADFVIGGSGQDWFVVTGASATYDPLGNHHGNNHAGNSDGGGDGGHGGHGSAVVVGHLPPLEGFALIDSIDKLHDPADDEATHTLIPHASDAVKREEHLSLFELVRYADVTHIAVKSGGWSEASTWGGGVIPAANARVLIPLGVSVEVDGLIPQALHTVRIDGTLEFAYEIDTELRVDTMVVSSLGTLHIGTADAPVEPNVTARLVFTDQGPINRSWDPFGMSRGLITHGAVEMHGAATTSHLEVSSPVQKGMSVLNLSEVPSDWKVGQQVVLTGTVEGVDQDEVREILSIIGRSIVVEPLAYDHLPPAANLNVHVANLTRNVIIESEATQVQRRGHLMFMHNRDVHINYVGLHGLGRSDKFEVVNDAVVDEDWNLTPGTGTNGRARYAVHFHRNGTVNDGNPATVHGSVAVDSLSWAFVNHSSFVEITDNVAYRSRGSAFVAEAGDEIGLFSGNIAIASEGSGELIDSRESSQDFAHTGSGFWFQGAGISVVDNISAGSDGNAFVYYTRGLRQQGIRTLFNTESLSDQSIANGAETILVDHVPVVRFDGNVGYASEIGLTVRYHLRNNTHDTLSIFSNSTFWNNETGIDLPYTEQTVLHNVAVIHDQDEIPELGVFSNGVTSDITYSQLTVTGYALGITLPQRGYSHVLGGTFSNVHNIVVRPANSSDRQVTISGAIEFVPMDPAIVPATAQLDIKMRFELNEAMNRLFQDNTVVLNYGQFNNQKVYFSAQHPDAIPFPEPTPEIPTEFVGLTSQQLWDTYEITVGGELAPRDAISVPRIDGIIGPSN